MLRAAREAVDGDAAVVAVAYADAARVPSRPLPPSELVARGARGGRDAAACSTPRSRTAAGCSSWLDPDALAALVAEAHDAGLEIALAGELRAEDLPGDPRHRRRHRRRALGRLPRRAAHRARSTPSASRGCARCAAAPRAADALDCASGSRPCGPSSSSSASRAGSRPSITHVSTPAARSAAGRCASTPPRRSAASSSTVSRAIGAPSAASRVEARDRLDEHEPPGARGAGHPRGDRVRRDGPRRGQRVALGEQRGRQQDRDDAGRAPARGRCARTAPGMRSASAQPNWSIARIAIRCAVSRAQAEAAVVARARRPRTPRRRARRAADGARPPPPIAAHSARSAPSPAVAREPAADLDDGQHEARRRAAASSASAAAGAASRSAALHGISTTARPRRSADRAGEERARAERHDRRRAPRRACRPAAPPPRSGGPARRGDRRRSRRSRRARAARRRRRRAARRARARRRRSPAARRASGTCRPRARGGPRIRCTSALIANSSEATGHQPPAHRDARRRSREVRAQRAGVDELAREQPVEVGAARGGDAAAGDRDHVGGRAARRRASARPGARAPTASALATQLAAATSSGRARASATVDELARGREDAAAGPAQRGLDGVEHEARRPRAWSGTRRRARPSSSARRAPTGSPPQLGDDVAHDGGRARRGRARPRTGARRARRASPSRHTAFVLAPPMSRPITPPIGDASRSCA